MRYELRLLLLLALTNGVVALERLSASFLSPYLVADLHLSNAQLGLLAGALSGAVAVSAMVFGRIADATGRNRRILVLATLAFSIIAGLPALVSGFAGLFAARMVLGLTEGPVVPVTQSMMADASDPRRRGFNMGFLQMAGAFALGATAGPVLATIIADAWGWRAAFSASMLPGLVVVLLQLLILAPDRPASGRGETHAMPARAQISALWRVRNVRLAILISGLFAAWFTIQNVFLPIYLIEAKGLTPTTMGLVVGAGGFAGLIGGLAIPAISDRIGRRPVMIACGFLAMIAPALIVYLPPQPWLLAGAVLVGWLVIGTSPIYIGVIPAESAPSAMTASAIALTTASGELVGGVLAPSLTGQLADMFGLDMPFFVCIGCALFCGLLAMGFTESATGRRQREAAAL